MAALDIQAPYLLFLAAVPNQLYAKTATGIAYWCPERCLGEYAHEDCSISVGLRRFELAEAAQAGAKTLVIGVANAGGHIEPGWVEVIRRALELGMDVANGLHQRLADIELLRETASRQGRQLLEFRRPGDAISVGTGEKRSGKRLLTVGTDCAVGKMFAALAITKELESRSVAATFRATGQTGILISGSGICIDAVAGDFMSGAVEQLAPANEAGHWDVIEGQGSLVHPSFAGVSLGILHGAQPDALILCHDPLRSHMVGLPSQPVPSLEDCIEANQAAARLTNPSARVVGISLNTAALDDHDALRRIEGAAQETGLPVVDPMLTGVSSLVDAALQT